MGAARVAGRSPVPRCFERRARAAVAPPAGLVAATGRCRRWWRAGRAEGLLPAFLLGLPALLPAVWPAVARRLQYDRPRIGAGELWRVVTCHWAHWSLDHLLWDLGMLVLLAALCWRLGRGRTVAAVASAAVLIPGVLWLASPELSRYRGLSGLDAALFVLLAAGLLRRERAGGRWRSAIPPAGLLLAFAGKVVYEAVTGTTLFVDPGADFVPVPLAHLVGGVCGGAAAVLGAPAGVQNLSGAAASNASSRQSGCGIATLRRQG